MTKTNILFSILACSVSLSLNAQLNYDLENFKSPEVRYQGMDASFRLRGEAHEYSDYGESNYLYGNLFLDCFRYVNTDLVISDNDIQFGFSGSFSGNENTYSVPQNRLSRNLQFAMNSSTFNNIYLNDRYRYFIQLDGNLNSSYYASSFNEELDGETTADRNSNTFNQRSIARVGLGYGRIEPVGYARLAYDTYAMLLKKNLIEEPTKEQVDALGEVMINVVNTRFFDSRFKRIFQLEQIDSTLRAQGLVNDLPIAYFAQLADVWNSANRFNRGSGTQVSGGIKGVHNFSDYRSENTVTDFTQDESAVVYKGLLVYMEYRNQKPLSTKWQRDIMLGAEFGDINDGIQDDGVEGFLHAKYGYGWYPNTRTSLSLDAGLSTIYGQTLNVVGSPDMVSDKWTYRLDLDFDFYYWISPRFRLGADLKATYGYSNSFYLGGQFYDEWWATGTDSPNLLIRGNASLSYALF